VTRRSSVGWLRSDTTEFSRANRKWRYIYDGVKNGEKCRTRRMENSKKAIFKCAYSELQGHVVRHVIAPMYLVVKHSGI
jgi:hypothetical protein